MIAPTAAPVVFEDEFIDGLRQLWEQKIVFNQTLGLRVTSVAPNLVTARIDMRPALVGHYGYNRIHGGVISAGLDAMGGLAVMAAIGARHMDETPTQRLHRFSKAAISLHPIALAHLAQQLRIRITHADLTAACLLKAAQVAFADAAAADDEDGMHGPQ